MLVYALVQYVAESVWCYVGWRRLRAPAEKPPLLSALTYGLVRLLIGRSISFLVELCLQGAAEWAVYLFILLPLRWLAWSFLAEFIAAGRVRPRSLLSGNRSSNLWRLQATLLSCLTDLPALLSGVWVQQFWP